MFINYLKSKENQELQRGNVIFYILLFIALFAALGFAVTQGSRSGGSQITRERSALAATEILDYANAVKRVIQELKINGCSDTEINFENSTLVGYENTNAPSDNACDVFHPKGGGLRYQEFTIDNFDNNYSGQSDYQDLIFTGNIAVEDVGSAAQDLVLIIPYIQASICAEMNNTLGIGTTIPIDIYTASQFTGTYSASANPGIGDDDTLLENRLSFCAQRESVTWYYFGQVLIAR